MRIWRICRKPFARNPLDGKGGMYVGGRWHTARRAVTYASQSLALASLEVLVHCDIDLMPEDLVAIEIDVPSRVRIATITTSALPRNWRRYPAPPTCQRLGNAWLDGAAGALLRVPSAVIPSEHNFVLNPLHPEARFIRVVRAARFSFDRRLLRRSPK
jgi:RES domain-containing protein